MAKFYTKNELYKMNTVSVKVEKVNRQYRDYSVVGSWAFTNKIIKRTKYLKICWHCGEPYETYKVNSFGCSKRCSWNINYQRKRNMNPVANMSLLTKENNVKEIKDKLGYK